MESEKVEPLAGLKIHQTRLRLSEREVELLEDLLQRPQRAFCLAPLPGHDDEVIGIAGEYPNGLILRPPEPVQLVQVNIGQQGRQHSALRRARDRVAKSLPIKSAGPQPLPNELHEPPITNPPSHKPKENLVINGLEETLDVGVDDPAAAVALDPGPDPFARLQGAPAWSESKRDIEKVRLEERLNHELDRCLYCAVPKRRDP